MRDKLVNADASTRRHLSSSFEELFSLLKELEGVEGLSVSEMPVFSRLRKSSVALED